MRVFLLEDKNVPITKSAEDYKNRYNEVVGAWNESAPKLIPANQFTVRKKMLSYAITNPTDDEIKAVQEKSPLKIKLDGEFYFVQNDGVSRRIYMLDVVTES